MHDLPPCDAYAYAGLMRLLLLLLLFDGHVII
jgi:hypothetical protein